MSGFSVPFILLLLFIYFVDIQGADHYEGRTRLSRRSTNTELKNKLDSIVSMLGKLNDKIDSQERRIAALSRQVGDINCNGEQSKGNRNCVQNSWIHNSSSLFEESWFDPGIWSLRWISPCYLRYLLIKNNQRRGSSREQKVSHWRSNQAVHLLTSIKSKQYNMLFSTRYKICFETFPSCFGVSFSFWSHAGGNRDHEMPRFMRI